MLIRLFSLSVFLAFVSCDLPSNYFESEVEIDGVFPAAEVVQKRTIVYRVVSPADLFGRYGIASSFASDAEVKAKIGTRYKIRLTNKDKYILRESRPLGASTSDTEDFFKYAVPVEPK